MSDPQSPIESVSLDSETQTLANSSIYDSSVTAVESDSASTIGRRSIDTYSVLQYSKLCIHCQAISDRLLAVRKRQEDIDTEYYSERPNARSSPSWPRPTRIVDVFNHYHIESHMKSSAKDGCALCARLLEGDQYGEPRRLGNRRYEDISLDEITAVLTFSPSRGLADQWEIILRLAWNPGHVKQIYIKTISNPRVEYPNPSTNTRDGLALAKLWLENCQTQHRCCNSTSNIKTTLPTRLLDLTQDEVRVRLGIELDPQTNYATLSHCWGSGKFLTLKNDNLTKFMNHIPPEALPRTFRDAIDIARYLGLQYLWIDSLCIIQDDSSERKRELELMSTVYGFSTINIAASGASDGNKGCFFDRLETWRCVLRGGSIQLPTILAYARWALWWRLVDMPLSKRGWGFQERILSKRTIFFTQKELFWECDELGACESFPDGCPKELHDYDVSIGLPKRPMTLKNWDLFVRLYGSSKLTVSKDKLVAISAIARAVSEEIKDEYVAGMWRKDLEHQLLWRVLHYSSDENIRPSGYRAPSWSWASLDCGVDLERHNTQPLMIKVENIDLQYITPSNPFGEILSGTLRLNCDQLIRGSIRRQPDTTHSLILAGQSEAHDAITNVGLDVMYETSTEKVGTLTKVYILPIVFVGRWRKDCLILKVAGEINKQDSNTGFFKLPSLRFWNPRKEKDENEQEEGRAPQTRQYQRIGRVSIAIDWDNFEKTNQFHAASYAAKERDYSEIRVDENGKKTYFIDLI